MTARNRADGGPPRLPDFLGIGAQKSGTTWLDRVLRSHQGIHLPPHKKEIHFFDQHYPKGIGWYAGQLGVGESTAVEVRVGEITPRYLFEPSAPSRIQEHLPDCRFLVLLRNPADRAYSHYRHEVRTRGLKATFLEFSDGESEAFRRGLYSQQLVQFFDRFDRERFLVLIFEEAMANKSRALAELARFLTVPVGGFDRELAEERVNVGTDPRLGPVYRGLRRLAGGLRNLGLDRALGLVREPASRFFFPARAEGPPPVSDEDRLILLRRYRSSISDLEDLLSRDLSSWKSL